MARTLSPSEAFQWVSGGSEGRSKMISHASDAAPASGVTVLGPMRDGYGAVLSPGALDFIAALTRRFREPAHDLLVRRLGR